LCMPYSTVGIIDSDCIIVCSMHTIMHSRIARPRAEV